MEITLDNGYKIKEMNEDEFFENYRPHKSSVFEDDHSIFPNEVISEKEKESVKALDKSCFNDPYNLYLGVFDKDDNFVGWHFGFQENAYTFYMCNSAILEEHRRKGLYSKLLERTVTILKDKGFQTIYSRHNATNNSVIIPKLKAGFVISSMEMDDVFGVMVHLKYQTNSTRRKIMDYRAGQLAPDDELKKLFKM